MKRLAGDYRRSVELRANALRYDTVIAPLVASFGPK